MAKKFSLESVLTLSDKITAPMGRVAKQVDTFGKKMKKNFGGVGKQIKAMDAGINKAAKGLAIGAGFMAVGAIAVGKSFIDAGKEVEKYKTVLVTMLGSQEAANARFEEMSKFAAETPFELNEVVQLGNQLQALGKYSKENMTILGDLAAAAGKPIDQVTGAFAKLASGQKGMAVDMFRDLLITTDDWAKATGKGVSNTGALLATTEEMLAALPKIMADKGFAGMMDNLSKSADGLEAGLSDTITQFKQQVGGIMLPAYKEIIRVLIDIGEKFSEVFAKKGTKYIEMVAEAGERLAGWLANLDIEKAIDGFIKFGQTIGKVVGFLVKFAPVILAVVAAIKILAAIQTVYNAVLAITNILASPITLITLAIVAAVALLVAGVALMVKHWDKVVAVLKVVGEFFIKVGQTMIKWMLTPVNLMLDAVGGLLRVLAKIPGLGDLVGGAADAIDEFQAKMNVTLTGSGDAYDYASPWTKGNESRSVSESRQTTVNEVYVRPDKGAAISGARGGAPQQVLMYGAAQ
jgi:hypothetical protein